MHKNGMNSCYLFFKIREDTLSLQSSQVSFSCCTKVSFVVRAPSAVVSSVDLRSPFPSDAMGCSSSKTSKAAKPQEAVYAAPKAEQPEQPEQAQPAVESTEAAVAAVEAVEAVETKEATEVTAEQPVSTEAKEDEEKVDVEEAEKAIGELKEAELKTSHVEVKHEKAEDTETVTTAPKEDSPRLLDVKVEAAETQTGPCVCGSLW